MKITTEINLNRSTLERTLNRNEALDRLQYLTDEEIEWVGQKLEDLYPDGMTQTELTELFWFSEDDIAKWLGYNDFDELLEGRDNK